MPTTNKNRDERIHIIHKCLLNKMQKWTREKLYEKVCDELDGIKISSRTINDDINYLRDIKGAPIETIGKGKNISYQYEYYDFNLNQPILDEDELFSLELAYTILNQLKEFNLSKELKSVISKMHQTLKDKDYLQEEVIYFEQSNNKINTKLFQEIVLATKEKNVLKINYKPFWKDEIIEKIIHPFFIKQYNKRWFLIGYNELENRLDNSPIDRIKKIKPIQADFNSKKRISHKTFSSNIIGVSPIGIPQKVVLEITATRAPYYLSKPFVNEFLLEKKLKNGNIRVSHLLYLNNELVQNILSFGQDIEVLKPTQLREQIKEILQNAFAKY